VGGWLFQLFHKVFKSVQNLKSKRFRRNCTIHFKYYFPCGGGCLNTFLAFQYFNGILKEVLSKD
jgi:hypothetical protein